MSYESENRLPSDATIAMVRDFVILLGYKRQGLFRYQDHASEQYHWFDDKDYKSWYGVELSIYRDNEQRIIVSTRTNISRSFYDLTHQNNTIRNIKRFFGGYFITDEGRNRYMHPHSPAPSPAQSGCHLAFQRFGNNLIAPLHYLQTRNFPDIVHRQSHLMREFGNDPITFSNNLLIPHMVSSLETYFKNTFVALLRFSERKNKIFSRNRLMAHHVTAISNGEETVEEAFCELLSFQSIKSIQNNFLLLDDNLDIAGELRRPYRRRQLTLYQQFSNLINLRHDIIHYGKHHGNLDDEATKATIYDLEEMVTRVYRHITALYGWNYEKWWGIGRR